VVNPEPKAAAPWRRLPRQGRAPGAVNGHQERVLRRRWLRPAAVPPPPAPVLVRLAFRVLERTAPGLGARWAERRWSEPPTEPGELAPDVDPGPGRPFAHRAGGHTVVGVAWGEGPVVHLVPGLGGDGDDDLAAFVAPLVARGHKVVAIDATTRSVPALARLLTASVAVHGPSRAVVAHATGATAAAVALGAGVRLGRLAMVAPVPRVVSHARRFAAGLGAGERVRDGLLARIERRAGVPLGELDVPALSGVVVTPPTFVVHDRDDAVVPVTEAAAIATSWPGTRLTVTSGLGHRGVLRNAWVVAEVVDFVTGRDPWA
jgi:hypothetical protein